MFFGQHDAEHPDALMRPMQSRGNRIWRVVWMLTWAILCRWTPNPMHAWRCAVLRRFGARLGKNNFVYPSAKIWAPWLLETGDVATIGPRVSVYNVGGLFIGHHAIVSEDAFLCGATHDIHDSNFTLMPKPVRLEPYSWVCARAVVLPGVTCHFGSVLGAAAVTARDLKAWTVYAGNPARAVSVRRNGDLMTDVTDEPPVGHQAISPQEDRQ